MDDGCDSGGSDGAGAADDDACAEGDSRYSATNVTTTQSDIAANATTTVDSLGRTST